MGGSDRKLPERSSNAEIDAFLKRAAELPVATGGASRGRLIFALDATASREPTWDTASQIQGQMFLETAKLGGLDVQLCYYRGFFEFRASDWVSSAEKLLSRMSAVRCAAGQTQIARVLGHALEETRRQRVNALVFVGDCLEEGMDELAGLAGQLGLLGLKAFMFHEGADRAAWRGFQEIARLSGGACVRFDANSPDELRALLGAVAVYAAGGAPALERYSRGQARVVGQITRQLTSD